MGAREQVAGQRMGAIAIDWNLDEFERIRKSEGIVEYLHETGKQLVSGLNAELHAAQRERGQTVEDGYKYYVTGADEGGDTSRARLHVLAFTARAMAHEAKHQSILKRLGEAAATTSAGRDADRAVARAHRDAERRARNERLKREAEGR